MAFVPTISTCIKKNCGFISVTDNTGVYDASTNTIGWEDASTLLASAVTALTLEVSQNGSVIVTENLLTQLPGAVSESFTYSDISVSGLIDGDFTVTYTVTTASDVYIASIVSFHACAVRCCIDAKWTQITLNGDTTTAGNTSLVDSALELEGLYASMINAAASGYTTIRNNYLTKLQRVCNITTGCGCATCDGCS
jgi:hypothetical protein|tara:strand:+ start:572 stop:1159 length:588 start_codon:yes stop_codon:yes gene_type:complete